MVIFTIIGCFFNSGTYDLALIESFFEILEIVRTFFHSIHMRIFKNLFSKLNRVFSAIYVLYSDEYFQIRKIHMLGHAFGNLVLKKTLFSMNLNYLL